MGGRILAALLSLVVLVTAGVAWARYRQFEADIPRVQAINSTTQPKKDIDGKDQNILITGNDDRETATDAELKQLGTTRDGGSLNTDTMMILHVPADGKRASAISFPRDSWVKIPGFGMDRLNAAYPDGVNANNGDRSAGAQLLVETLQNLTGLTIDHYVQVDLLGFYRISIAIGGVRVCLNQAAQDEFSGINLPAGWQTIEGTQALAFVRQRHGLDGGDLDRIKRQQYFLSAVFRQITSAGTLLNPLKLNKLLGAVSSSLQMDGNSSGHSGLDPLKLASQMQDLSAGNLTFTTIPVTADTIDGKSVLTINEDDLPVFINGVIGTTTTSAYDQAKAVAPSTVSVSVLNGSGGVGVAGANAATLTTVGFQTTIGNADTTASTTIRYPAGMESQAKTLALYVPGAAVVRTTDVSVVTLTIGTDGKQAASSTSAPAPTAPATGATPTDTTRTAAQADCIN
ncbi:MAG: LytR family transcriptional regulator [Pseudonocardiales bacterium]|nr:LytR family transcriptional regulator [Pseudonocardiales bacterium]